MVSYSVNGAPLGLDCKQNQYEEAEYEKICIDRIVGSDGGIGGWL